MKRSPASAWNFLLSLEGNNNNIATTTSSSTNTNTSTNTSSIPTQLPLSNINNLPSPTTTTTIKPPPSSHHTNTISANSELLHLNDGVKLVVAMCGLPGRGKTHVAKKVANYFSWLGYAAKHFEVASLRRAKLGPIKNEIFFDPTNEMGIEARTTIRNAAMDAMINWLRDGGGQVAVYDTSNTTIEQRKAVTERLRKAFQFQTESRSSPVPSSNSTGATSPSSKRSRPTTTTTTTSDSPSPTTANNNNDSSSNNAAPWCRLIWIECGSEDTSTIQKDFLEATLASPDYQGLSRQDAIRELEKKSAFYLSSYVSLESPGGAQDDESYVKITDLGRRVVAKNVMGYLESKLVSFLMNIHIEPRVVYIARHGESEYNTMDRIGGDSPLTQRGMTFAQNLARFCQGEATSGEWSSSSSSSSASASSSSNNNNNNNNSILSPPILIPTSSLPPLETSSSNTISSTSNLVVWTSTATRAIQTAEPIQCRVRVAWNALAEIDAGACESMTYGEIQSKMPLEYAERQKDKFHWRYPRGESYADVVRRLESVIFEIERQRKPVLVIAHRAVARCLLGYFEGYAKEVIPYLPMQLHSVVKLSTALGGSTATGSQAPAWKSERFLLEPIVEGDLGAHENDVKVFQELLMGRKG
jgi:broad specificity phosphatase PhoE